MSVKTKLPKKSFLLLLVDGEAKCTLAELIEINAQPDVTPIEPEDLVRIENLSEGESLHIGLTEIRRIEFENALYERGWA